MQETDRVEIEIDHELIGHRLDLSRPELQPILGRYFPRSALIVGYGKADASLKDALIEDGWQVRECEGPGSRRCPLMSGKPACHLRQSADVAVVCVDGRRPWSDAGMLPRLRCAADEASPAVIALEGRVDPPTTTRGHVLVGKLRGPKAILKAARAVACHQAGCHQEPQ